MTAARGFSAWALPPPQPRGCGRTGPAAPRPPSAAPAPAPGGSRAPAGTWRRRWRVAEADVAGAGQRQAGGGPAEQAAAAARDGGEVVHGRGAPSRAPQLVGQSFGRPRPAPFQVTASRGGAGRAGSCVGPGRGGCSEPVGELVQTLALWGGTLSKPSSDPPPQSKGRATRLGALVPKQERRQKSLFGRAGSRQQVKGLSLWKQHYQ